MQLAETGSFSRAAELRYVTQPAFSRRIRALEQWLGAELIDRTSYPTKLTKAGEQFRDRAAEIVRQAIDAGRLLAGCRARRPTPSCLPRRIPLSLTFSRHWLHRAGEEVGSGQAKLLANVHDAVMSLVEGNWATCCSAITTNQPVQLDESRYEMVVLGTETIAPFPRTDSEGRALFIARQRSQRRFYLSSTPQAYLGRMVELILQQSPLRAHLDCVYENDMSEALKGDGARRSWPRVVAEAR